MKRIICFFFGHKWKNIMCDRSKTIALGHLSPDAGLDADCSRCWLKWRNSGHSEAEYTEALAAKTLAGGQE